MERELRDDERQLADDMMARARAAMAQIEGWSQEKLDRLAQLPKLGTRIIVCVDDQDNVAELAQAVARHDTQPEHRLHKQRGVQATTVTSGAHDGGKPVIRCQILREIDVQSNINPIPHSDVAGLNLLKAAGRFGGAW